MTELAFEKVDMSGMEYMAPRGKQTGNMMMVIGMDRRYLLEDKWIVRSSVTKDVWSVEGDKLRELLKDKIEHAIKRQKELNDQKKNSGVVPKQEPIVHNKVSDVDAEPAWKRYTLEEFRNAELLLVFHSRLVDESIIIISHAEMYKTHADEIKEKYEKYGGVVYTIDELNDFLGTGVNKEGLKSFHLLKKMFVLRYIGKAKS